MTIYDDLVAAGLPVLSATEGGTVSWQLGAPLTLTQMRQAVDIITQHLDPAEYTAQLDIRADVQMVIAEYQNMITRLQTIQTVPNPTNAQVIQAVRDVALYIERILKYHAQQVRTGEGSLAQSQRHI